jgi:uncharacterized protein with NAD-binding domain and iron-sulfur cluster
VLVPRFFDALKQLFPRARDAQLLSAVVTREYAATFRAVPGIESLRRQTTTGVPGLLLAGAWCDTGWPATMEGAVRSGNDAATKVVAFASGADDSDEVDRERVNT